MKLQNRGIRHVKSRVSIDGYSQKIDFLTVRLSEAKFPYMAILLVDDCIWQGPDFGNELPQTAVLWKGSGFNKEPYPYCADGEVLKFDEEAFNYQQGSPFIIVPIIEGSMDYSKRIYQPFRMRDFYR